MKKRFQIILVASAIGITAPAHAAYQLLGNGVCRAADWQGGPTISRPGFSWAECKAACDQRSECRGVEFNVRSDTTVCELHLKPVKLKASQTRDRILSCWGRY